MADAARQEPSFAHKLHVATTLITKMNRGEITPEQARRSWLWFRNRNRMTAHRTVIETDFPLAETLARCVELAEAIEGGTSSSVDRATLVCHLRVLRDDLSLTDQVTRQWVHPNA